MLSTQLFITKGIHPIIEEWKEIKNEPGFPKPLGGLWTSTLLPNGGSGWTEWCERAEYDVPAKEWKGYLITPSKEARICTINSYKDLEDLYNRYPVPSPFPNGWPFGSGTLDFEVMSRDYDVIHLTEKGLRETSRMDRLNLYGWDLESSIWLNWAFEVNREPVTFPVYQSC